MPGDENLSHIPGPPVPRFIGHTLAIVKDAYGTQQDFLRRYGDVYKVKTLGEWRVNLCGPEAMERVLLDRDQTFSSTGGWDLISRLFSGGLMLQDFDEHRQNRRIMQSAFRAQALQDYMARMQHALSDLIDAWPKDKSFDVYPAVKELTLRLGCAVFMGLPVDSPLARDLNAAFTAEIRAAMSIVRNPVPFTPMWRGVRGRAFLRRTFQELVPQRRARPGTDFFSQMCIAKDENGAGWSDDEIIDQFNFLMMAAHDTTATALTAMIWALGAHPEWQDVLAQEIESLGADPLDYADLAKMSQTEHVLKEALRLIPPVPFIPRRVIKDFEWKGYTIPAGTEISLNPGVSMMSAEWFSDPYKFDPGRFSSNRAEDKVHPFAWAPFGGGAHKCIGMHFSTMQIKLFALTLFQKHRVALVRSADQNWLRLPIPRPKGGLPIKLTSAPRNTS